MRNILKGTFQASLLASLALMAPAGSSQSVSSAAHVPVSGANCLQPTDCGGPFSATCPANSYSGYFTRTFGGAGVSWTWHAYSFTVADYFRLVADVQNPSSPVKPDAQGNISISIQTGELVSSQIVPGSDGIGIWESNLLNGIYAVTSTTPPCLPEMLPIKAFGQFTPPSAPSCAPLKFNLPDAVPGAHGGYRLLKTVFKNFGGDCVYTKVMLEFNYDCLQGILAKLMAAGLVTPSTPLLRVTLNPCNPVGGSYAGPGDVGTL